MELLPMDPVHNSEKHFYLLSELVLNTPESAISLAPFPPAARNLSREEFDALAALATKNHVILRAFACLGELLKSEAGTGFAEWVSLTADGERARIENALGFL